MQRLDASLISRASGAFELHDRETPARLALTGRWISRTAGRLERELAALNLSATKDLVIDLSAVELFDTAGAWLVHRMTETAARSGATWRIVNAGTPEQILLDAVAEASREAELEVAGAQRRWDMAAPLVSRLLADNAVAEDDNWVGVGGGDAVDALINGRIDAAFLVISAQSPLIARLLRTPDVVLADFTRADAYARRYPYLSTLLLPRGVVDLGADIPARPVHLLAPAANIVVRHDLHPAVIQLMMQAASDVHRRGGWFERNGEFPKPELLAFPLSDEADRFYKNGPPFLQRYLPFWAASLVDRLKVMLLPLLVLLFPLVKVMPPIYTWRMRARIYRWYDELENAEMRLGSGKQDAAGVRADLDRIEAEVQRVKVPLSFTDQLYQLRQHIELVRRRIHAGDTRG